MTSFTLVRRIAARPSIVFEAMTTAEGISSWWGPDDLPVIHSESDARVGGAYRVRFRTKDGLEHEACGEYLEVVHPRRLAMTFRWAHGGEPEELGRTSRIEVDLSPLESGTEIRFMHAELNNEASRKSHEGGWAGAFAKLLRRLGNAPDPAGVTSQKG